ncbi:hypothetical protein CEG14_20270 [Bordetella genomosp. 1]|uniref:Acyl-CoA dehydrogenase n=1 Tax=Bordetella genomosp. 1 TaxID=1395607 RepID=A0A261S8S2_9BORD|nr:acyl-CoA dehydrogenase family protein [Bordetella genomosp. 1]OZI33180.1 hypothetical protein CEG14_20270 [Bordetella genomosp. 1]
MQRDLTEDQRLLDDAVARYVSQEYPAVGQPRGACDPTADPVDSAHWQAFAGMGLIGLGLPESAGGMGAGLTDVCVVMQRLGYAQVTEPYDISALLCGQLLALLPAADRAQALLAALAEGRAAPVLAHTEAHSDASLDDVRTLARRDGDGWVLDGAKCRIAHGAGAAHLLVTARTDDGVAVFLVDGAAQGLARRGQAGLDGRSYADLRFSGCQVPADACLGLAGQALAHAADLARIGLCAEAVGSMQALLDSTRGYLETRKQFGKPLIAFQALQHRLVDMLLLLEQSRSLMWRAASAAQAGDPSCARLASAAKYKCGQAGRHIGQQSIHLHGGMGMTQELGVGRHVKRLMAIDYTLGDAHHHLNRYQRLAPAATLQDLP